ncbi:MAG: hypothetical protein ACJ71J_06420 [Nitrososphaeraceae archaeon]
MVVMLAFVIERFLKHQQYLNHHIQRVKITEMKLLEERSFKGGIVSLRYQLAR